MFLCSKVTVQQRCCNVPPPLWYTGRPAELKLLSVTQSNIGTCWTCVDAAGQMSLCCVGQWPRKRRRQQEHCCEQSSTGEGQVSRLSRAETPGVKMVVVRIQYKLCICLPRMKLDWKETFASILIDDSNLLLCLLSLNRTFLTLHWYTWEQQQSIGH